MSAANRWKGVVWLTALFSITSGWLLLSFSNSVSIVTWHKVLVGWAQIIAGLFIVVVRLGVWRHFGVDGRLWAELSFFCGALTMRIPMAFSQALNHAAAWSQALSLSDYVAAICLATTACWVSLVFPGARKEWRDR